MRLFIAIPLLDEVKQQLISIEHELAKSKTKMSLVREKNMHVTLKFIGDGDPKEWKARMDQINEKPFEMVFNKIGCFPEKKQMRVVWAGCEAPQSLLNIHRVIANEKLLPHATLARIRGKPDQALLDMVGKEIWVPVKVGKVQLLNSTLRPDGPSYEVIHEKTL